jgi:S-adenosylmethionine:tRNA ribosyltransferase-isomerase
VRTDAFDYDLPRGFIAQQPAERRDQSRLLVLDRATGRIEHRHFCDVGDYLEAGDLLVLNDTRVVPARLIGRRQTGGWVELLLIGTAEDQGEGAERDEWPGTRHVGRACLHAQPFAVCRHAHPTTRHSALGGGSRRLWRAIVKSRGRLRPGEQLALEGGELSCMVRSRLEEGQMELEFDRDPAAVLDTLQKVGRAPLPPYIKRPRGGTACGGHTPTRGEGPGGSAPRLWRDFAARRVDRERYQTVYASRPGAIAAPTAGLHFTPELLERLEVKGTRHAAVTLHVGLGTFKPVTAERIEDHVMHAEYFELSGETAAAIAATREAGRYVMPVGSTATRVLETVARGPGLAPTSAWTNLFITPGFEFRLTDRLITNFHLPRSTLLILVSAFAGRERVLAAYEEAKRRGYRFYSYGDAMLIL